MGTVKVVYCSRKTKNNTAVKIARYSQPYISLIIMAKKDELS